LVGDEGVAKQALHAIDEAPADSLIAVVGPTASGKTELSVALAELLNGEVVSADSVQIYSRFDIGSGKPTAEQRTRVRHHLVGAVEPFEPLDAGRYVELADRAVNEIASRGKRAIVCGGTFLWVRALLFGLAHAPPADPAIRESHKEQAAREGHLALHSRLREIDPELAARLHPNDVVRVSRGLEVHELTGRPLSSWQGEHGFRATRRPVITFAIERSPQALTERIERRVQLWLSAGWIEEVRALIAEGYGQARAMGSVGYRQVAEHVDKRLDRGELSRAIVRATRVFARRQRTWLNHGDVVWLGGRSAGAPSPEVD
jgi:tRNA dimethylallyltransferase